MKIAMNVILKGIALDLPTVKITLLGLKMKINAFNSVNPTK